MTLHIESKDIVVPGEILAEGLDYIPGDNAIRDGENVVASRVGLAQVDGRIIQLIPLSGVYKPKPGDKIICKVFDITMSGWRVETNTAYSAMLNVRDASSEYIERGAQLSKYFEIGDYIITKITNVTSQNLIDITMKGPGLQKLGKGRIIEVNSCKVPRIIGRKGSMVAMIKKATDCNIIVGQNGLIWLKGNDHENELAAVETIRLIETNAHKQGLTEYVENYLKDRVSKK